MTDAGEARANPYIGPRAFQIGETIYGRDREILDLLDLLIAERIVLLYSPSGAGKTSLIQAGLIPQLVNERFLVLPVIRVNQEPAPGVVDGNGARNRYLLSTLLSLEEALPSEQRTPTGELAGRTLDTYLDQRTRPADAPASEMLIFDQFEEILAIEQTDQEAKTAFFAQLGDALRNPRRWVLFAMREEYVPRLDPFLRLVPTHFSTTYRLDLLGVSAARLAIQQPARQAAVTFEDAAAQKLVDDLCRTHIQHFDGTTEERLGPSVEPVQLQVVCRRLWERLPPGTTQIGEQNLALAGDVNNALAEYYAECVRAVAAETGVSERAIRDWFDHLITETGLRGQVLQGPEQSEGLQNSAIRALVDTFLVRSERRLGATWFELAHDRLIEPIRANNAAWREANLSMLQRQADLWGRQGRPAGLLLRDEVLAEAERWAESYPDELTATERDFLEVCRVARAAAQREARQTRYIRNLAISIAIVSIIALITFVVAFFFFFQADLQRRRAEEQRELAAKNAQLADLNAQIAKQNEQTARSEQQRATQQQQLAQQNARVARARELATEADNNLMVDPLRSVLLATEAVSATSAFSEAIVPEAGDALQQAVQASRVQRILAGHTKGVQALSYRPDGTRLATASNDNTVKLWDTATGQELLSITGHTGAVLDVTYSPDGARLATASADGTARIWDAASGQELATLKHDDEVNSVAYNPDGTRLATAGLDGTARIWDAASGQELATFEHDDQVDEVAFSRDGQLLATASGKAVFLWDVNTGDRVLELTGQRDIVQGVAFSPDGRLLATASLDGTATIWDTATRQITATLQAHTGSVNSVAFSADGRYLATASTDGTARLWNPATGRMLLTLAGHSDWVQQAVFSPDGTALATASLDRTARIWSLGFLPPDGVLSVAFSPNGELLASSGMAEAQVWDAPSGRSLLRLQGHSGDVNSVTYSPDGKRIATASFDRTARVWDAPTGKPLLTLVGHEDSVNRVTFSPDGSRLATVSDDKTARIWDAGSGRELLTLTGHEDWVVGVAFSRDGARLATADRAGVAIVWDTGTGQRQLTLRGPENSELNNVTFSPDGKRIATAGGDGNVRIWDAATGTQVRILAHPPDVRDVAFSPDGARLAAASRDKTLKLWDAVAGQELMSLTLAAEPYEIAFSPDSTRIAVATADGIARIYLLDRAALLALAHQRAVRTLTLEECGAYHLEGVAQCAPASSIEPQRAAATHEKWR